MTADSAPLEGLRVVELGRYIQGPVASMILAGLGADVVKIEDVGQQDPVRQFTTFYGADLDDRGRAWMTSAVNRGKRAVGLDIANGQGREVFRTLVERADVFVTNLRDSALVRLGADHATLHGINPRLVYGRGGGFGFRGDLADEPCQDTAGMAYGGLMDAFAESDSPTYPPGALSDVVTGTNLAGAILAGLVSRSLNDRGQVVGASQLQSALWMQLMPIGLMASLGQRVARFRPEEASPLMRPYRTATDWMVIAVIQTDHWHRLAQAIGLGELVAEERYATLDAANRAGEALAERIERALVEQPASHWLARLRKAGVWVSPVNRLEQLHSDPQVLQNDLVARFDDGFVGPRSPFEVGGWRAGAATSPAYGEHTDEVLAELGYDEAAVLDLRIAGAIW